MVKKQAINEKESSSDDEDDIEAILKKAQLKTDKLLENDNYKRELLMGRCLN